jgi:hypothetical protein
MDSILDEGALVKSSDAAVEVDEDARHDMDLFTSQVDNDYVENMMTAPEQQVKVVMFWKTQESSDHKMKKKLKQRLDNETDIFLTA